MTSAGSSPSRYLGEITEALPEFSQVQVKTGKLGLASDGHRLVQAFCRTIRPVNINTAIERINEKAELGAVGDVFLQLLLKLGQGIAGRSKLDDEIRTNWGEDFLLFRCQRIPSFAPDPRGVGRPGAEFRRIPRRPPPLGNSSQQPAR